MEPVEITIIYIQWAGWYSFDDIYNEKKEGATFKNPWDKGVYQIYGHHPVYGSDVLLYIGMTTRPFYDRLCTGKPTHLDYYECFVSDTKSLKIYLGRLAGNTTPDDPKWDSQIRIAEELLIIAHKPATNGQSVKWLGNDERRNYLIVNRGNYRSLLPEVYSESLVYNDPLNVYGPR